jgi:hypothetical protein
MSSNDEGGDDMTHEENDDGPSLDEAAHAAAMAVMRWHRGNKANGK